MIPRFVRPAAAALAFLSFLPATAAATQRGQGTVGEWELVWRYSEAEGYQNTFRASVENGIPFPFTWRHIEDHRGNRLAFFDRDGVLQEEAALGPGERALACGDGSAYLVWAPEPDRSEYQSFRFLVRGEGESRWEASAPGEPVLFAPDGTLFVIASLHQTRDQFLRLHADPSGRLQVVGASGDVRGELPIYPTFSCFTGDQRRVAFLRTEELVVLARNGTLDWQREVPVDNLAFREGVPQLATGEGIVVVCGTGSRGEGTGGGLLPPRVGSVIAYDDDGRRRWVRRQTEDEELWFQISAAVSSDGGTVVTCYAPARSMVVSAWEGETGEPLWTHTAPRHPGFRSVSVTPGGQRVALAQCDHRTNLNVWDREGIVVWQGDLPLSSKSAKVVAGDLLVAEEWVMKLTMEEGEP